jgi:CTP synthase (UTP-ammonia lyase)
MVSGRSSGQDRWVLVVIAGDFDSANPNHPATDAALAHAAADLGLEVRTRWSATAAFDVDPSEVLDGAAALFLTTGSPYGSLDGALAAIKYARMTGLPFLGTCGGFQHVVVEAFRNVAGLIDASHGEYDQNTPHQVIAPLSCSLAGQTMTVQLVEGSLAARAYGMTTTTERYYCQYGIGDAYRDRLAETGLVVTGTDADHEPRVVEVDEHPFFMGTLFVPQAASSPGRPHPVISALLSAAADRP